VKLGLRIFYETDVKPWLASRHEEIRRAYVGPGWRHINNYERLGRSVWGTVLILLWIALCSACLLFFVGIVMTVVELITCVFKPGCTISFHPPE
jgi:hypothetical protein